ncbi:MAG TPA: signal recognition particle-docking protein FtsY [Clostridia bacterium]|nr:signal recognition particle-docking protein FtsY [Clostridia bacterium]
MDEGVLSLGFFDKLKAGLTKTREGLVSKVNSLISGHKQIDEEFFEELEEILIQSDVGVDTSLSLVERVRQTAKEKKATSGEEVKEILKEEIKQILAAASHSINLQPNSLTVILVVGVNGAGKTTTIGKLAAGFVKDGKKVVLAAADTFRAAAIEQLEVWAQRSGAQLIKHQEGSDPAAVAFDGLQAARSRGADVLLIDTAGRLQNKKNLMNELNKIVRVLKREIPEAPHEVLLVLDATTGQNALSQALIFKETASVTGIVLTKLDGTAKGGVIIPVADQMSIPVKYIGVGEGIDDLKPFQAGEFVEALFAE